MDPRIPPPHSCVLRNLLDRHAQERPDAVFAVFADGSRWTYSSLQLRVRRAAAGLQGLGIGQGEHVLCWLPNGPQAIVLWFALNYIGAVYVPLNTSFRGQVLSHAIRTANAKLMVAHRGLLDRLVGLDTGSLELLVLAGSEAAQGPTTRFRTLDAAAIFDAQGEPSAPPRPIQPWDLQSIIYTSGTTGPSKAVLSSYVHLHQAGDAFYFLTESDRGLTALPLFHQAGMGAIYRMLIRGASIAVVDSFRTRQFWDDIRATGATFVTLVGAMSRFLLSEPPATGDRQHTLRCAVMVPLTDDAAVFRARFGADIYATFNMTEVSCPLMSGDNPTKAGTCGRPRPGVEARVVDENDCEVPAGTAGELILRSDVPWAFSHGYYLAAEATAAAWRNGWFHTGDGFIADADGDFLFVDRMKDAIRRRGENVSAFEVEREIMEFPGIREVAVVAVPSQYGEDEVMAVIAPVPGHRIDPAELDAFLVPRLAHFMVPRYIRLMDELPKTSTQKVQKFLLREEGMAGAWDRAAQFGTLKRERLA